MYGYVQRAETKLSDTFQLKLTNIGQRDKVPMQKGMTIIIILYVKTVSHFAGHLVNETKKTLISTLSYFPEAFQVYP